MPKAFLHLPVSPSAAWAALSDITEWPTWLPTVTSVSHVTGTPTHGMGAAFTVAQPRLRTAVWTVTSWAETCEFVWQSSLPGVRTTGTHALSPGPDGGTDVALAVTWSGPLAGLVRAAYGRRTGRYLRTEAVALGHRADALA